MKIMKRVLILLGAVLALSLAARAQGTANDLESDLRSRTSIDLDWKLAKGLHLDAGYELRTENSFSALDRHQLSLGLSWKIAPWLKAGASYSFLYHHHVNKDYWAPRHRFDTHLTFSWKTGDWRFSLKETLRVTHKTESVNYCEEVQNPLMLKSRFKVQYKGIKRFEPYAFIEARNIFNDPSCSATWSTTSLAYGDYQFTGYNSAYFNRLRGALGAEWKLSKHSALDFYAMLDYCYDKHIDVDKTKTYLKSLTWDRNLNTIIGVGYTFSF